ncbi:hypothetical protein PV326_003761 [Microctonus aethiopoides]|uniref:Uncharacterized protein n=1 Tax=Microctonus aethiopoides TaxID=144406 RepID=A0AA39F6L8_9HYME|nr:hypothetical protein PV326_003761 [Microctonus aethiopoides]KAK0163834.1 hypothetical protein PV328_002524 [Microctonus aethiopoides]
MGACLGQCFANVTDPFTFRYSRHSGMPSQEDEQVEWVDDNNFASSAQSKSLLSFLSLKHLKRKRGVAMELVEDKCWKRDCNKYTRLKTKNNASTSSDLNTSFQTLDARILMKHPGCLSSTPASSLDLEWEHEVIPLPTATDGEQLESTNDSPSKTSSHGSQPSSLTASPWSRVSTPNSLEWDSVEGNEACIDIETEQLLTEIERLTDKTLKETGEWTGAR